MDELRYEWLADELVVCRLAPTAPVPDWLPDQGFTTVTRTTEELSIVCAAAAVPAGVKAETGWAAFKVLGPLPFDAVGILRRFAEPLADVAIPIIAIGTFDTDYVLVKKAQMGAADTALAARGLICARGG
ncbi:MAG: ACT domain-containing protein [Opitutaceae bacterium]|jgi:uncharacterized protein|nr:ACT domain-containing protein [Opitutaceae bacterium]